MKAFFIGVALFMATLFASFQSINHPFPIWIPPIGILFSLGLWIQFKGSKSGILFFLAVWNGITWWLGSMLYSDWGTGDWNFLFVKAPVVIMLLVNLPLALFYFRGYIPQGISSSHGSKTGLEWFLKIVGVQKKKEENNAIDFILGEEVDDASMGRR
jgi:hypothetical protein